MCTHIMTQHQALLGSMYCTLVEPLTTRVFFTHSIHTLSVTHSIKHWQHTHNYGSTKIYHMEFAWSWFQNEVKDL